MQTSLIAEAGCAETDILNRLIKIEHRWLRLCKPNQFMVLLIISSYHSKQKRCITNIIPTSAHVIKVCPIPHSLLTHGLGMRLTSQTSYLIKCMCGNSTYLSQSHCLIQNLLEGKYNLMVSHMILLILDVIYFPIVRIIIGTLLTRRL